MSSLPLRRRMTIAVAIAVAVAVALAAMVAYLAVRGALRGEVDRALEQQRVIPPPQGPPEGRFGRRFGPLPARFGGPTPYIQIIDAGDVVDVRGSEQVEIPVEERARDVAAGVAEPFFADVDVNGTHTRVLTAPVGGGFAVQFGRSLEPADSVLARLRLILLFVVFGGVALAVALGRLVSRNVVAPIVHVTDAARHIAATEDLGRRIEVETHDEVGELAEHFNAMLDTLERSVAAQRQLVADASHELRTPITSLRTNIEVLAESEALPPGRARPAAGRRRGADDRAGHARRGPDRARPRRRAVPGARGHPPGRPRPRGRHPRQAPRPRRSTSARSWSPRSSTAPASASRAR